MKNVIILGSDRESAVLTGAIAYGKPGYRVIPLDSREIGDTARLTILNNGSWELAFRDGLSVTSCHRLIWRSYDGYERLEHPFAQVEARALFESWLELLGNKCVNPYAAWLKHSHKPSQYIRLSQHKATSPHLFEGIDTAWSSDCGKVEGDGLIWKPITSGGVAEHDPKQVSGLFGTVQDKQSNEVIRIYIVDGKHVASFQITGYELDYRAGLCKIKHYTDGNETMILDSLAIAESEDCTAFCAVEFVRAENGQLRFLEVNPSPMFVGFDEHCGGLIGRALIEMITQEEATQDGN